MNDVLKAVAGSKKKGNGAEAVVDPTVSSPKPSNKPLTKLSPGASAESSVGSQNSAKNTDGGNSKENSQVSNDKSKKKAKKSKTKEESSSDDLVDPRKVSLYLLNNPSVLDDYIKSCVDLERLRDWLDNKERIGMDNIEYESNVDECMDLIDHFQQGQKYGKYLEPSCCTCTQLPPGAKSRRPYIIYALDADDDSSDTQYNFTVPRVMTEAEMCAFSSRYGMDLQRRMNMY